MNPEIHRELQRLLSALCDHQLSEIQHTRLEELLQSDAECRRLYLEYVDVHAQLLTHQGLRAAAESPLGSDRSLREVIPHPTRLPPSAPGRRKVSQALRYALVAAGTLAASLLVQFLWRPTREPDSNRSPAEVRPPGYVATLTQAAGCLWEGEVSRRRVGSRLLAGEMRLRQGIARLHFDGGSDLVVEGPAVLRLDSGTAATVLSGKIVFKGDETGVAFDLHTPSSTLVDLGTEYAVVVGPEGEEVHVFEGEVERTPNPGPGASEAERLKTGEARRYQTASAAPGQPTPLDPERFVRLLKSTGQPGAEPATNLLAYEGFDYQDPQSLTAGTANGGTGWAGPWRAGFARPLIPGDRNLLALNVKEGLTRQGAGVPPVGGSFDYTGFAKYYRRLATPVRLDVDGVYYLSFLFRRHGPPADPLNAVAVQLRTTDELEKDLRTGEVDLRKRLNVGIDRANHLFTHLERVGTRTPLPMTYGETYLLVAKIAASGANPDQVFLRVYGPQEPIEHEEPGGWTAAGPLVRSDLVLDWLEIHANSKTRQTIDEIRLGTTWASVTAPWIAAGREEKP
jgi:ferric-dicitrate binding protein FerR (iron transport regulator)